ncbi:MAG: ketopantoate reductase family protein [Alphaproteobacteria bacterium]|nr:MAG: ketopantoate reductase family protein [Alphaproteobacteria bacterium]
MRILVLGAGAVGGYFGGRLAEAGRDVTFLVRAPRAATLAEKGLKVDSALGDFQVPVKVATADRVGGPYDLVLLTAKHYDLDAAIDAIRPGVGPGTAVLPLLNGLIHLARLEAAFGRDRVLGGVAYVGAVLLPDGSIRHVNRMSGIAFGERGGGISERAKAIEQQFANTPVAAPANDNILQEMWEKFVMMGAMAGMNCLMRGNVGEIVATEEGEALMAEALRECQTVAEAAGFAPRPQSRDRVQALLTERGSVNSASMRQDLEAGRRTEADAILGDMLRRARHFGDDRAQHDAALLRRVIAGAAVHRRPLVPDQQIADLPGMVIDEPLLCRMRRQLLDQRPGLFAVHPDKAVRVHRVDEQDRAAGDRVVGDRRPRLLVILLLRLPFVVAIQLFANGTIGAAVQSGEAGQPLFHAVRQGVIGGPHIGEHRAAL